MYRDKSPPGTLHLLILKALAGGGELKGYEFANWPEQVPEKVLQVEESSLG
jgi:hypothetical protein